MAINHTIVENLPSDGKNTDGYKLKSDMCSFVVPYNKCNIPNDLEESQRITGLTWKQNVNGLKLNVSGKIFATPTSLGLITAENYLQLPEKIYNLTGIEIDEDYVVNNAELCRFDATEDNIVEGHPQYYISAFNDVLKRSTDKFSAYKHRNTTYDNGLSVKPKSREKITFDIYVKGPEIRRYKDYCNQFDYDFLQSTNKIIRCEYQIMNQARMRKEFNIPQGIKPTMSDVFACKRNVVGDMLKNLVNGGEF